MEGFGSAFGYFIGFGYANAMDSYENIATKCGYLYSPLDATFYWGLGVTFVFRMRGVTLILFYRPGYGNFEAIGLSVRRWVDSYYAWDIMGVGDRNFKVYGRATNGFGNITYAMWNRFSALYVYGPYQYCFYYDEELPGDIIVMADGRWQYYLSDVFDYGYWQRSGGGYHGRGYYQWRGYWYFFRWLSSSLGGFCRGSRVVCFAAGVVLFLCPGDRIFYVGL